MMMHKMASWWRGGALEISCAAKCFFSLFIRNKLCSCTRELHIYSICNIDFLLPPENLGHIVLSKYTVAAQLVIEFSLMTDCRLTFLVKIVSKNCQNTEISSPSS